MGTILYCGVKKIHLQTIVCGVILGVDVHECIPAAEEGRDWYLLAGNGFLQTSWKMDWEGLVGGWNGTYAFCSAYFAIFEVLTMKMYPWILM